MTQCFTRSITLNKATILLFIILLTLGCGKKKNKITPSPITGSPIVFIKQDSLGPYQQSYNLSIPKKELKKIFILRSRTIDDPEKSVSNSFASKIVYFQKIDQKILMIDQQNNNRTLASFSILNEKEGKIIFDFNSGMRKIFRMHWSRSDIVDEEIINISKSSVEEVKQIGAHTVVYQKVIFPNENLKLQYTLSPLKKNINFTTSINPHEKLVGLFQASKFVVKHDISNPIIFHISASTPAELRSVIKDGILYWNKAFEKKILEVKILKNDNNVYHPDLNVIKWFDEPQSREYGLTDIQIDPTSGEILKSNIYLSAKMAEKPLGSSQILLQRLANNHIPKKIKLLLKGFNKGPNQISPPKQLFNTNFSHILKKSGVSLDQKIMKRFMHDHIRSIVAHEVGHALGIKHNFAGSMKTNIDSENYEYIVMNYFLRDRKEEDVIESSSVMDYLQSLETSLAGARIRFKQPMLDYDFKAIKNAYYKKYSDDYGPFCTDEDNLNRTYINCAASDHFSNAIKGRLFDLKGSHLTLPQSLANNFYFLKQEESPSKRLEKIRNTDLNSKALTDWILSNIAAVIKTLEIDTKYLNIQSPVDYKDRTLEDIGGFSKNLITPFMPSTIAQKDYPQKFINAIHTTYKVSIEEEELLKDRANEFFAYFSENLIQGLSQILNSKYHFNYNIPETQKAIKNFASQILLTKSDEVLGTVDGQVIKAPIFPYLNRLNVISMIKRITFHDHVNYNQEDRQFFHNEIKKNPIHHVSEEERETLPEKIKKLIEYETILLNVLD